MRFKCLPIAGDAEVLQLLTPIGVVAAVKVKARKQGVYLDFEALAEWARLQSSELAKRAKDLDVQLYERQGRCYFRLLDWRRLVLPLVREVQSHHREWLQSQGF